MKITVLGSGSKGNSTLIEINDKKILIDVGFSYKHIKEKLEQIKVDPKEIDYLLITHEHKDHIYGLNVFLKRVKPLLLIKEKLYNTLFDQNEYSKVQLLNETQEIDGIKINVISLSHDAVDPVGFLIEYNDESMVYIADTGYINHKILPKITNKTYYLLESNHDTEMLINGPYPPHLQRRILSDKGHLSNEFCGSYLSKVIGKSTKKVILIHLSETNNDPCIALDTTKKILKENNVFFDNIECANQQEMVVIKW